MRLNLRKLVPEHLGGSKDNIYNAIVERTWLNIIANWFWTSPDYRPPLWLWIRGKYKKYHTSGMFHLKRKPLWDFVKSTKPKRILEIGLGDGRNAKKIMKLAGDCEYYCFDIFCTEKSRRAYEDMKGEENVSFFMGYTKKTLPEHIKDLPKMDLIFIDGGHDYETVKNDWNHCKLLMHESTACFFHDYDMLGPWMVVKEIQDEDEYSVKIIEPPVSPPVFALIEKKKVN